MAEYDNGTLVGYDTINPYHSFPITFEQLELPSGRKFIGTPDEYLPNNTKPPNPPEPFSAHRIKRADTPVSMIEGFMDNPNNNTVWLLFLLIIIAILQVKMMMTIDFMMTMQMASNQRFVQK